MFCETIKKKDYIKSIYVNEYNINYLPVEFTNAKKDYNLTPKHPKFEELIECTKIICKNFDFVRCDYYIDINKDIYFSELTFSPSAGTLTFKSKDICNYFGSLI